MSRGCLFAPVWIDRRVAYRRGWYYSPTFAIYDDSLYGSMFVRRGSSSYYFGDYFETRFSTMGYRSWFSVSIGRNYAYDPMLATIATTTAATRTGPRRSAKCTWRVTPAISRARP